MFEVIASYPPRFNSQHNYLQHSMPCNKCMSLAWIFYSLLPHVSLHICFKLLILVNIFRRKIPVELIDLDKLSAELNSSDRILEFVQWRGPDANAHNIGNDQHDGTTDGWHCWQANLKYIYISIYSLYSFILFTFFCALSLYLSLCLSLSVSLTLFISLSLSVCP